MAEAVRPRLILVIAIVASFVAFLDSSIATITLPAISDELGGGLTTQQWVMDAYLITLGALILLAGSLSDAYGRMRVLVVGLIGFGVTSLAVAFAPSAVFLIVARAAQGAAGALLVPSSLALITATFSGPAQARAIGTWTAATTGAMVAGPLVGGLFVDLASWRWAFAINVLPVALALVLVRRTHHRDERRPGARVDGIGAALAVVGLGGIVFALIEQERLGIASPWVWGTFVLGAAAFAGFLWWQTRASQPLMPLDLFRARNFSTGNVATFFVYAALSLSGFAIGVYLQQGAGFSATFAGLATLPQTILMIAFSALVGAWAGRAGPRGFMTVGPALMAAGSLLLVTAAEPLNYWAQLLPGIVLMGVGLTLTVSPLTAAVLGAIDPAHAGVGSAVNNAISRVAGLLSIAFLGPITGGTLDLAGFHRAAIAAAALFALGALVSWIGVRNAQTAGTDPARP